MRDIVMENGTCLERKCVFSFEGREFESGGAFIGINSKTGRHGGLVYGEWTEGIPQTVSNWHGDIKVSAAYGPIFRGNMGDRRRHVRFTWRGIKFHGLWSGIDNKQCFNVREVK